MFQNIPKTEHLYQKSKPIDHLSVSEGISLMVKEQKNASIEVKAAKSIEKAIEGIHRHLLINSMGRIIYAGDFCKNRCTGWCRTFSNI